MFTHILQKIRTIYTHPSYWRAIIACNHGEPLHYHHDGCPACDSPIYPTPIELSHPRICVEDGCTGHISDTTDGWLVCDLHLKALYEQERTST